MPSLYRRSTVFVEVQNMAVSYDTIVATRLERYFFTNKGAGVFFLPTLLDVCKLPVEQLKYKLMEEKSNKNFLLNYFDWSKAELSSEVNPIRICEKVYWDALCMSPKTNDVLHYGDISHLMTSIGSSFQLLTKDTNLNTIYFYLGFHVPDEIQRGLVSTYQGDIKCTYLKGTRVWLTKFLQTHVCDSYFFEDCTDVDELICRKHPVLSEVLVPGNSVNLTIVDEMQGTKLRDISLEHPLDYYKDELNLDIHSISLPI